MLAFLWARLGSAFRTKVGIALVGALVLGGGGTALAIATAHGSPLSAWEVSQSASSTPHATKTADQDDQDDQDCTGGAHATPGAHSDDGDDHESGTPSAHASPTAHSDDGDEHESGTPSATKAAGQGDDEANEHEGAQGDQDECGNGSATRTPHPEPTERPEGTHPAGATPTEGSGGD
jgi:hypothetical protein